MRGGFSMSTTKTGEVFNESEATTSRQLVSVSRRAFAGDGYSIQRYAYGSLLAAGDSLSGFSFDDDRCAERHRGERLRYLSILSNPHIIRLYRGPGGRSSAQLGDGGDDAGTGPLSLACVGVGQAALLPLRQKR